MLEVVLWPFSSTLDNQVLEFNIINYNRFSQVWVKKVCQQEDACVVPHQHQQQVWGTPRQSIWNIKNGRMTWVPKRLLIVIDVTKWFEWLLVVVMGKSLATFWHPLVPGRRFLPHGSVWLVARCSSAFMAGELLGPFLTDEHWPLHGVESSRPLPDFQNRKNIHQCQSNWQKHLDPSATQCAFPNVLHFSCQCPKHLFFVGSTDWFIAYGLINILCTERKHLALDCGQTDQWLVCSQNHLVLKCLKCHLGVVMVKEIDHDVVWQKTKKEECKTVWIDENKTQPPNWFVMNESKHGDACMMVICSTWLVHKMNVTFCLMFTIFSQNATHMFRFLLCSRVTHVPNWINCLLLCSLCPLQQLAS